ncbi:MAG: hypothetical protein HY291_16050 [Planctomycetes bacterium]|nr:hypothetical protein [Planctomycetota bacterium]
MRAERSFVLDAPPAALWPLVANTDSLNRELGLPVVAYNPVPKASGGTTIIARASMMGQEMEWVEHPYEWIAPREYSVEREFVKGPFKRLLWGVKLLPEGTGTKVEVFADLEPRGFLGQMGATLVLKRNLEGFRNAAENFNRFLKTELNSPYPKRFTMAPVDETALAAATARLREMGAEPGVVARLAQHLCTAVDEQVTRMRPFELASRWKTDRYASLRTFLYATRAGLVDMTWNVVCPSCRGVTCELPSLSQVRRAAHCPTCGIHYDADFDRTVEVRFNVNAAVRKAQHETFCAGGPGNTPHYMAQLRLKPGETRALELDLAPGRCKVSAAGLGHPAEFEVLEGEGGAEAVAHLDAQGVHVQGAPLRAGPTQWTLNNASGAELIVHLERAEWSEEAVNAAMISTLQDFRDLFSKEMLAAEEELSVRSLTFIFTDLKGSTGLYEAAGDAQAYTLVRAHFALLIRQIREHHGAVVKTIGDAVMAAFLAPEDAVRAALAIQRELAASGLGQEGRKIVLKLGMHTGPCIAVNANDKLDYFGTTVNLAQRAQSQSLGHDLVLTQALSERDGVRKLLEAAGAKLERFEAEVKGFSKKIPLTRAVLV